MSTAAATVALLDKATLTVPEMGAVLGIGRNAAYQLVREGRVRSLHIGRRIIIPSSAVRELLGER
nr:helix-turn-helix domain-containing protein [Propionicimonas sp.]